jgi:hypothetical protein
MTRREFGFSSNASAGADAESFSAAIMGSSRRLVFGDSDSERF